MWKCSACGEEVEDEFDVCGHRTFHERNALLNTRFAIFMNVDSANAQAVNDICNRCGYIFGFWGE